MEISFLTHLNVKRVNLHSNTYMCIAGTLLFTNTHFLTKTKLLTNTSLSVIGERNLPVETNLSATKNLLVNTNLLAYTNLSANNTPLLYATISQRVFLCQYSLKLAHKFSPQCGMEILNDDDHYYDERAVIIAHFRKGFEYAGIVQMLKKEHGEYVSANAENRLSNYGVKRRIVIYDEALAKSA